MSNTGMQTWSTTASSNANADANVNFSEGMAPSQVNDSARAMMASAAKWVSDNNGSLLTGGSSTQFVLTTNQVAGSLVDGYTVSVVLHTLPAANATFGIDNLTPQPILFDTNHNIGVNQILPNTLQRLTYKASASGWLLNSYNPGVPVGAIIPFAGAVCPGGWLFCDGTLYTNSVYTALFAAIGTTYGSGSGTFAVPDLRGRFLAGFDNLGGGSAANRLTGAVSGIPAQTPGGAGGAQSVVLIQGNMPVTGPTFTGSQQTWSANQNFAQWGGNTTTPQPGAGTAYPVASNMSANVTPTVTVTPAGTVAGGSATPVVIVPPTMVINYIIFSGKT